MQPLSTSGSGSKVCRETRQGTKYFVHAWARGTAKFDASNRPIMQEYWNIVLAFVSGVAGLASRKLPWTLELSCLSDPLDLFVTFVVFVVLLLSLHRTGYFVFLFTTYFLVYHTHNRQNYESHRCTMDRSCPEFSALNGMPWGKRRDTWEKRPEK